MSTSSEQIMQNKLLDKARAVCLLNSDLALAARIGSPDGDRITPERLRCLLFSKSLRLRRDKARAVLQGGIIVTSFAARMRGLRPDAGMPGAGEA